MARSTKKFFDAFTSDFPIQAELENIVEFYIAFSRFEFCLKMMGYRSVKNNRDVSPNWADFGEKKAPEYDSVINALEASSPIKLAIDAIFARPPKKQIVDNNNKLAFRDAVCTDSSPTKKLIVYVPRIRHNLFHGAKIFDKDGDTTWDKELIQYGLTVLSFWVDHYQNLQSWYFDQYPDIG